MYDVEFIEKMSFSLQNRIYLMGFHLSRSAKTNSKHLLNMNV